MKGVKVYKSPINPEADTALMKDLKIDTVLLGDEASRDSDYQKILTESGIDVFIVFPVFYNPSYLKKNSRSWAITEQGEKAEDSWVQFVCPSDTGYIDFQKNRIREIARLSHICGITLDFIRFFTFWEMVKPETSFNEIHHSCFCGNCIAAFSRTTALPQNITGKKLNTWILKNELPAWTEWKEMVILSAAEILISELKDINSRLKTAIHIVPWESDEFNGGIRNICGQNVEKLSRISDFITPMTYAPMCHRDSGWINRLTGDLNRRSANPVIPAIQVSEAYDEPSVTPGRFRADLQSALKTPSEGVLLWSWETLKESPEKMQIFKEC